MPNRIYIYLSLLMLLCFSFRCDKIDPGTTAGETAQTVKVVAAEAMIASSPDNYEAVGTVKAETTSTLSGKLMGTIKAVNVREGDRVITGQLLIVIDNRQVAAQLKQAEAFREEASRYEMAAVSARDAAKAGAELAQVTYKRFLKLKEDNATSLQEFDQADIRSRQADATLKQSEAALEAARQRIKQTEAAVASAEVSRKDAEISAPFDGVVIARMVDVGDLSAPGTPFLTIEKSGGLEIDAIIPEDYIHLVNPQQNLKVVIPVLQNLSFEGTVKSIVTAADSQSRTFIIKVSLPNITGIHSGIFVRINIPLGDHAMILIPSSAVINQGQLTGLFIVDENSIARFRLIRTGSKTGDSVEVISGLKNGTRYVVTPPPELKDGMKVEASS